MAIPATAVWEVRAEGAITNGGFYNATVGSTDYSQQDAAQLALNDAATDGAGTGVSSVTGGFTAAMVGNGIYITGGGTTTGWYEIVAYTDTNNITIDRSAGATKSSVTCGVGGAVQYAATAAQAAAVAGNKVWIKKGTYTPTANWTSTAGTEALDIQFIGYKSTRGDVCDGDDRPLFALGAYYWSLGNYVKIRNIRSTGTAVMNITVSYAGEAENVKCQNTSATAGRDGLRLGATGATAIDCELISDAGAGLYLFSNGQTILGCYIHDCGEHGIRTEAGGGYYHIAFNIIDTCVKGIQGTTGVKGFILNNVIYGNTTSGIELTTGDNLVAMNNILMSNGVAMTFSADHQAENYEDYNHFYNNTTDRTNINAGAHSTSGTDPKFTDAPGGDFSLQSSSPMIDKGFAIRLGVG